MLACEQEAIIERYGPSLSESWKMDLFPEEPFRALSESPYMV